MALIKFYSCTTAVLVVIMAVLVSRSQLTVAAAASASPSTAKTTSAVVSTTSYGGDGYVEAVCSGGPIPSGSAFWGNLGATLHQLVENTAYSSGFYFKTQNGGKNCPAYGEASCDTSVISSPEDCTDCLFHLSYRIWSICGDTLSARVKYGGCSLHYDNSRII